MKLHPCTVPCTAQESVRPIPLGSEHSYGTRTPAPAGSEHRAGVLMEAPSEPAQKRPGLILRTDIYLPQACFLDKVNNQLQASNYKLWSDCPSPGLHRHRAEQHGAGPPLPLVFLFLKLLLKYSCCTVLYITGVQYSDSQYLKVYSIYGYEILAISSMLYNIFLQLIYT